MTLVIEPALALWAWRILPAIALDLTGYLKRWYLLGLALTIAGMLPFFWTQPGPDKAVLITGSLVVSQAGTLLLLLAAAGMLTMTVRPNRMGRAAGAYQVGLMGGALLVLLGATTFREAIHWQVALGAELLVVLLAAMAIMRVRTVRAERQSVRTSIANGISAGHRWLRSRTGIFTTLMVLSPIGVGAATVAWWTGVQLYAVPEEKAQLLIGPWSMGASILGFLVGGWTADRYGRWKTWLWAGTGAAVIAIGLAVGPPIRGLFESSVLGYAVLAGCCTAASWAVVVGSTGRTITGITALSMAQAVAAHYMRAFDGNVCDNLSFAWMLMVEAVITLICIGIALFLKRRWHIEDMEGTTTATLLS
jgi:hypothetical protein